MNNCEKFENCNAPICPMIDSPESNWFPNEKICSLEKFNQSPCVQSQKKIVEKIQDYDTYFTFDMLNRNFIVTKRLTGIDPDSKKESQLIQKWIRKHPSKHMKIASLYAKKSN